MIYRESTILPFGKYKGQALLNILRKDPQYLNWCRINIRWFRENLEPGLEDKIHEEASIETRTIFEVARDEGYDIWAPNRF